jgi:tyrosine decarboxylase/aspartate 1-decarboxylase
MAVEPVPRWKKSASSMLGRIYGWEEPLGHLTGGGTMANLEALWIASRLHPGKRIIGSAIAHYTHSRISEVLGVPFSPVAVNSDGRIDIAAVEAHLDAGDVGTVIATIGNTGLGAVDSLDYLLKLQEKFDFRIHADAAYGGYFGLTSGLRDDTRLSYDQLSAVDSIVIDPRKHGLQPYGCGGVLFRDASVGRFYKHDSPYTYFSSAELHLGEISLECSRPGAAAVAVWATQQLFPLTPGGGQLSQWLDQSLLAAREFWQELQASSAYQPLMQPELDIVVYAVIADDSGTASQRARRVFSRAAEQELHLALIELPTEFVQNYRPELTATSKTVTCLRSALMKPEHREWVPDIMKTLNDCVT